MPYYSQNRSVVFRPKNNVAAMFFDGSKTFVPNYFQIRKVVFDKKIFSFLIINGIWKNNPIPWRPCLLSDETFEYSWERVLQGPFIPNYDQIWPKIFCFLKISMEKLIPSHGGHVFCGLAKIWKLLVEGLAISIFSDWTKYFPLDCGVCMFKDGFTDVLLDPVHENWDCSHVHAVKSSLYIL